MPLETIQYDLYATQKTIQYDLYATKKTIWLFHFYMDLVRRHQSYMAFTQEKIFYHASSE